VRDVSHLTPADARRLPWKNGRGVTEELAVWPPGASFERGDFDWRISKATVAEAGPFSAFAGFDRVLVVVDGDALVLSHEGAAPRIRVERLVPYRFDGGRPTSAELTGAPVRDFNVITRRGCVRADVSVLRAESTRESLVAGHAFVHVVEGATVARVAGADVPLATGDSLWLCDARDGDVLELAGAFVALLVQIAPV
jgi:uncharacterized protein